MNRDIPHLSLLQQVSLVALRTFIGWHFLYEGYVKLLQLISFATDRFPQGVPPSTSRHWLKPSITRMITEFYIAI